MKARLACVALLLLCGCTGTEGSTSGGQAPPVACPTQGAAPVQTPVPEVSEAQANVVFKLQSLSRPEEPLTVKVDGRLLFEVRTPADPEGCFADTVSVRRYALPAGPVTVEALVADKREEVQMTVGEQRQWVVIQNQSDFPLSLKASNKEPRFG